MPASPLPPALVELVLSGARDIARVPTALDAELTLSTLLGGGYAALEPDRGPAFEALATDLGTAASATDSAPARVVAAILAGARLALLPDDAEPAAEAPRPDELIGAFLESPEARLSGLNRAAGAKLEAVGYGLGLCVEFAQARGGDPLRWSPRAVEAFLLEWVHGRAVLDPHDAATLPDVLSAWVSWAGRRVGLPEPAVTETLDKVDALRPEFIRLCTTGERQSPAVKATAPLVAEGG